MSIFGGAAHHIDAIRIADLPTPDFGYPNRPNGVNADLAKWFRSFGLDQMVVFASDLRYLADASMVTGDFTEIKDFKQGRELSRHGVYFGQLALHSDLYPDVRTYIAVKPYDKRRSKVDFGTSSQLAVVHEWATNMYLNSLSSGSAYEPVGVWRAASSYFVPQLMTKFYESSVSLDNAFRKTTQNGGFVSGARMMRATELGFSGVGIAHGAHLVYGDASPQNFAIDGRKIIFNDTTSIQPYPRDADDIQRGILGDIEDFTIGTMNHDSASEEMSELAKTALEHPDFVANLYRHYLDGAALGAERAGYERAGILVKEDNFTTMIQAVLDRYGELRKPHRRRLY